MIGTDAISAPLLPASAPETHYHYLPHRANSFSRLCIHISSRPLRDTRKTCSVKREQVLIDTDKYIHIIVAGSAIRNGRHSLALPDQPPTESVSLPAADNKIKSHHHTHTFKTTQNHNRKKAWQMKQEFCRREAGLTWLGRHI